MKWQEIDTDMNSLFMSVDLCKVAMHFFFWLLRIKNKNPIYIFHQAGGQLDTITSYTNQAIIDF